MQLTGGSRFDLVRFFVIFLAWIIGAWFIIYNSNQVDREGLFMFDGKLSVERQEEIINAEIMGEEVVSEIIEGKEAEEIGN